MRYQFAEPTKAVEEQVRKAFAQAKGGEMCIPGAIRLMLCGTAMPLAVFLSDSELSLLEENGYDRNSDPYMLHNAVVLVMESKKGEVKKRGIYEQGNMFELWR